MTNKPKNEEVRALIETVRAEAAIHRDHPEGWLSASSRFNEAADALTALLDENAALQHDIERTYQSLQGEMNARLEAESALATVRRDTGRLDALQAGKWALFTPHFEGDTWHIMPLADDEKWEAFGATLRLVIDAALAEQPK